jgi:hypothetical protein
MRPQPPLGFRAFVDGARSRRHEVVSQARRRLAVTLFNSREGMATPGGANACLFLEPNPPSEARRKISDKKSNKNEQLATAGTGNSTDR